MSKNIDKVKQALKVTDAKLDNYLIFCELNISNKIKDKCNIDEIPERLDSLIQEFLIEQYLINKDGIGKGVKEVKSASDNKQKIDFETIGGAASMSQNAEEFITKKWSSIVMYRKIRW